MATYLGVSQSLNVYDKPTSVLGSTRKPVAMPPQQSVDVALNNLKQLSARPWILDHLDWTSTLGNSYYDLFDGSTESWEQFLHYLAYVKCGLKISCKVNGTNFHQGLLCLAWVSAASDGHKQPNVNTTQYNYYTLTSFPHIMMNASSSDTQVLLIQYNNIRDMLYRKQTMGGSLYPLGKLVVFPMVPLSASTGASTSLSVTIWVEPVEVEANAYTIPEYAFEPTSPPEEYVKIPISKYKNISIPKKYITHTLRPLFEEQAGDENTNPLESVVKTLTGIATPLVEELGNGLLDKPDPSTDPVNFVRRTAGGFSTGKGMSTAVGVGNFTPGLQRTVGDDMYGRFPLREFVQVPGVFKLFNIDTTQTENHLLEQFPVSPHLTCNGSYNSGANVTALKHTPVSYISQAYKFWRGTMKYRITFVATAFQQALVAVMWIPDCFNGGTTHGGYSSNATKVYCSLVEVRGSTTYDFSIPFTGPYPARDSVSPSQHYTGSYFPPPDCTDRSNSINGYVRIYLVNKFVAPNNAPSSIQALIWGWGGEDLDLAVIDGMNLATESYVGETYVPDASSFNFEEQIGKGVAEESEPKPDSFNDDTKSGFPETRKEEESPGMGQQGEPAGGSQKVTETRTEDNSRPLAKMDHSYSLIRMFGEDHMDLNTILKRYQLLLEFDWMTDSDKPHLLLTLPVTPQMVPTVGLRYYEKIQVHQNLLTHFAPLYSYWRGSLRYRVVVTKWNHDNSNAVYQAEQATIVKGSFRPMYYNVNFMSVENCTDFASEVGMFQANYFKLPTTGLEYNCSHTGATMMNGAHLEQTWQNGVLDVTVPFFINKNRCVTTWGVAKWDDQTERQQIPRGNISGFLDLLIENTGITWGMDAFKVLVFIAAGDDFELSLPTGAPYAAYNYRNTGPT